MEYAYRADIWQALYAAVAGSAAALTGLLFIGLSLNLRIIVKTLEHTARARETFGGLLSLLVLFIREGTQRYKRHKRYNVINFIGKRVIAHPRYARNTGSGEPLASATRLVVADQLIYHDPDHPSGIVFSVLPG